MTGREKLTANHVPCSTFWGHFSPCRCRHDFGERIHPHTDPICNGKDLSRMKACKRGFERACNYGQHVVDKQDWDICHAAIDNTRWTCMAVTFSPKQAKLGLECRSITEE